MTRTLAQIIDNHGVEVHEHLDREDLVPVTAGMQRQGDVIVIPRTMAAGNSQPANTPVPRSGVAVVRGENGGNTHLLLADGQVYYDVEQRWSSSSSLDLGVLTVTAGATAFLAHPEHGYAGIVPGSYVLRRQREQADQIRLVQD